MVSSSSFPCSRSTRLILLVDSAAPAEPANNVVYRGDAAVGTAPGQLVTVTTPSLARRSRFHGCITSTCGTEVRAVVALGR